MDLQLGGSCVYTVGMKASPAGQLVTLVELNLVLVARCWFAMSAVMEGSGGGGCVLMAR